MSSKKCIVSWCDRKTKSRKNEYCPKHDMQIRRDGAVFKTRFDPNDFIDKKRNIVIVLRDKKGNIIGNAFVSKKDKWVKNYKWFLSSGGYPSTHTIDEQNKDCVRKLHKIIFPNNIIDHKNRNKLDNRRKNLRTCSRSQNQHNRNVNKNNKSGMPGVSWFKNNYGWCGWRCRITVQNKEITIGYFQDYDKAVKARLKAEQKYFGKFSPKSRKIICQKTKDLILKDTSA